MWEASITMREADTRRLLEVVADCASAREGDAFTRVLLSGLLELIPAELATQHEFNRDTGHHTIRGQPDGSLDPGFAEHIPEHASDSPIFGYHVGTLDGRPLMESDFLSQRAWRRRGLYNEVNRPLGIEEELAFVLVTPRMIYATCLSDRWGAFGDRERRLLDVLRGPLGRVRATVSERETEQAALGALGGAVDATRHAVVLLGPIGTVHFASPAARDALERFGVCERALNGTAETLAERDHLRLCARRLPSSGRLVTILLEERPAPHPELTPREVEVLELVAEGLRNSEIADHLYISTRTVERHLRNIYDKLDVRTRTGAVARGLGDEVGGAADAQRM
jgi:DNA-binding CsgD family transcriptional regulator